VLWILIIANVFPLLGGYGVMCKVWNRKINRIPSTIELMRKTPKMDDKWKTCKQWSMEALAC
jgi:hypothetical protein